MRITCGWNNKTGETQIKFIDIPNDVDALDFLRDCIFGITNEYNWKMNAVFLELKQGRKQFPSDETDYGSFL